MYNKHFLIFLHVQLCAQAMHQESVFPFVISLFLKPSHYFHNEMHVFSSFTFSFLFIYVLVPHGKQHTNNELPVSFLEMP